MEQTKETAIIIIALVAFAAAVVGGWFLWQSDFFDPPVLHVEIKTLPFKVEYTKGQSLDTRGLVLLAMYDNGSTKEITRNYSASGGTNNVGTQTVKITYRGKQTSYAITVNPAVVISTTILKLPNKIQYSVGQTFNPQGLVIRERYSDNTISDLPHTMPGITYSAVDMSTPGRKEITVYFNDVTAGKFNILVN